MMTRRLLTIAMLGSVVPLAAQQGRRCRIVVENVDREGAISEPFAGYVNYFAGGDVRLRCDGQDVRLAGDSLISLNSDVIYLFKNASYRDASIDLKADSLVYSKQSERVEARGAVTVRNLKTGSTITGPHLDYLRAVQGMRDSAEVIALERPTVRYLPSRAVGDTADPQPYVVVADRLRGVGSSRLWGGGTVTIDRGSLSGRADSLTYLAGSTGDVELTGIATLATVRDTASDSLLVEGTKVTLGLAADDLRSVRAYGSGHVNSRSADIRADSIAITLDSGKVAATAAWDRTNRALVRNEGYDIRGDSIWISSPDEKLREIRVFGRGVLQNPLDSADAAADALRPVLPDSLTPDSTAVDSLTPAPRERDTLWGHRIIAAFRELDSAGTTVTRLQQIEAVGSAASLFSRDVTRGGVTAPSITYTTADTIVIVMREGDSTGVSEVRARRGAEPVHGVQLEAASIRRTRSSTDGAARREERR